MAEATRQNARSIFLAPSEGKSREVSPSCHAIYADVGARLTAGESFRAYTALDIEN
jgi:hypothetical protein